jgi:hypothetical protein
MSKPAGVFIQPFTSVTNRREDATDRDNDARGKVKPPWHSVPAIQVDSKKDRFGKEGETFERKRHAYD